VKRLIYLFFLFLFIFHSNSNADEELILGKKIFIEKGNCITCHSFMDAGSNADIGPNLNEIKPEIGRVIIAVTNGIGVMPAYEGELSSEEIKAVARYVSENSN
tara:strand:- start:2763 stop:3071 length:309 start_codon:yes stop_codon:yes gene_type:complete